MRIAAIILALFLTASSLWADWVVNSSPSMVNSGIDIQVSEQRYAELLYYVNGEWHVTFGFKAPLTSVPYDIWDVNMASGVSRVVRATAGYPPTSTAFALATNSLLILGSSEPAHLWSYDPATGSTNHLFNSGEHAYISGINAIDGLSYFGSYYRCEVDSYDPATGTVKNWGQMDPAVDPGSNQFAYAYTVGADAGYIYAAIRENFGAFNQYLSVLRKSDTNKTQVWKTGTSTTVEIKQGLAGQVYARQVTNAVTRWWSLTNEVPVLLGAPPSTKTFPGDVNGEFTTWHNTTGWMWNVEATFDVSSASGSPSIASVRYKPTTNALYTTTSQTNGWSLSPGTVDLLAPWAGNELLWIVNAYGPLGTFEHQGTTSITGPFKGISAYDFLQVSSTEAYIAGYYQSTLRWDPSASWTRAPLQDSYTSTNVNPYTINPAGWGGIYHHYLARGNTGKIYVGSHHERGSSGGELGWYDPTDGSIGSNRLAFVDYDVNDLKAAENGTKLVYASRNTNIIIWDVGTFTQVTNFTMLAGATLDRVTEYSSGNMLGVSGSNLVGFTTSGVQLWSNNLPVAPWGSLGERRRLTLGPDSYAWIIAGGVLYRVNPADGSKTAVLTTTNSYNTVFDGTDCFLYGGSTGVWKIASLLTNTAIGTLNATTANIGTINLATP